MAKPARPDPLQPRKLPRQERATQTVQVILESAAHILETEGFGGYSTNAIAARAGVSIGSVYQYFRSKDGITLALIEEATGRLMTAIAAAAALPDARTALDAMITAAADQQLHRPQLAQLLDMEERRLYKSVLRDDAVFGRLNADVAGVIERLYGRHQDMALICSDVATITRALCDATGPRRGSSRAALEDRIRKAVHGYLREQISPQPAAGRTNRPVE